MVFSKNVVPERPSGRADEDTSSAANNSLSKSSRDVKGLNVWQTSLFIIGEIAGSGILALPNAILGTGWIGILLLIYFCMLAGYSGLILGRCWMLLEERYEECRQKTRSPYQVIALKAYGVKMSRAVDVIMTFTLFGVGVVFALLLAGMLADVFSHVWNLSICSWSLIVFCVVTPLTWFGSPKDFWVLAMTASLTVLIAAVLLLVQTIKDGETIVGPVYYPAANFRSFSLAFGAMLFGYGGASAFPVMQNDMKDRRRFPLAAVLGFSGIMLIYLPVAVAGYLVYGYHLQPNLALTIGDGPLKISAQILLIVHLLCAINIAINPVFQTLEEHLNILSGFNWKRPLLRTLIMAATLFVGESIPEFGKILDLIGGSTNTMLTFIFPCIFYWKLSCMKSSTWKSREAPLHEKVLMVEIILIGILGGISATLSALWEIASPDAFSLPCYLRT